MYLLVPAGPIDSPQIWVYRMIPKTAFHKRPQTHSIKVHWRGIILPNIYIDICRYIYIYMYPRIFICLYLQSTNLNIYIPAFIYIYIYVDVSSHPFHQGTCWSSYPPAWYETQWPAHLAVAALWPFAGRGCWWSHWTCGPWDWHQGDPTWNKLGIWIFSRAIGSIGFWMEFIEIHRSSWSIDVTWCQLNRFFVVLGVRNAGS